MDPIFFKTELLERQRLEDETRQAQQARLARLARSNEALHRRRATDWLQSNFNQVLAGLRVRLYQLGNRISDPNISN